LRLVALDEVPVEVDERGREGLARYIAELDLDLICTSYLWDGCPGAWDGIDAHDLEAGPDGTVVAFPMLVRRRERDPGRCCSCLGCGRIGRDATRGAWLTFTCSLCPGHCEEADLGPLLDPRLQWLWEQNRCRRRSSRGCNTCRRHARHPGTRIIRVARCRRRTARRSQLEIRTASQGQPGRVDRQAAHPRPLAHARSSCGSRDGSGAGNQSGGRRREARSGRATQATVHRTCSARSRRAARRDSCMALVAPEQGGSRARSRPTIRRSS